MIRRNRLENGLRRQLFYFSKGLSPNQWTDLLRETLSNIRFNALLSTESRILFSQKESPLYWTDLMCLIKSEIIFPYLSDRRKTLVEAMVVVNFAGRNDTHAKEMNQVEFEGVDKALCMLEDEFSDPE